MKLTVTIVRTLPGELPEARQITAREIGKAQAIANCAVFAFDPTERPNFHDIKRANCPWVSWSDSLRLCTVTIEKDSR